MFLSKDFIETAEGLRFAVVVNGIEQDKVLCFLRYMHTSEGWLKVDGFQLNMNMFVARVVGKSMEPRIPDGSYCVFQANVVGSRNDKIVLVQLNTALESESGGRYTVKKYSSKKRTAGLDSWEHEEIVLLPLNPAYQPIVVPKGNDGEFMVVAELVRVL